MADTVLQQRIRELPAHHPLMDARQSARQLLFALGVRVGAPSVPPSEKT